MVFFIVIRIDCQSYSMFFKLSTHPSAYLDFRSASDELLFYLEMFSLHFHSSIFLLNGVGWASIFFFFPHYNPRLSSSFDSMILLTSQHSFKQLFDIYNILFSLAALRPLYHLYSALILYANAFYIILCSVHCVPWVHKFSVFNQIREMFVSTFILFSFWKCKYIYVRFPWYMS